MSLTAVKGFGTVVVAACLSGLASASTIGRPVSFNIALYQDTTELFNESVTVAGAGVDPLDGSYRYKIVADYDSDPCDTLSSVWITVQMPAPEQQESNIHFYIRGASPNDPDLHGADPLLTMNDTDKVHAVITDLQFENAGVPSDVSVYHYDNENMAGAYVFDYDVDGSYYYQLPGSVAVDLGPDHLTQQVPQSEFMDADVDNYVFLPDMGTAVDVGWYNMSSPTSDPNGDYPVIYQDGVASVADGQVFEMGLAAVVLTAPEPATFALALLGGVACFRRRR